MEPVHCNNEKQYDAKYKNYLAPIKYLISHYIYEYDISKANVNVLYNKGIINEEERNVIMQYPRNQRQIYMGLMQRDPIKSKALSEGLAEYRYRFLTENNIENNQILSVKNDAIFLIDKTANITHFDDTIDFMLKNVYTSFYNLNKKEVYYSLDLINNKEVIDIKGIDDSLLPLHQDYMIMFLCTVFEAFQTKTIQETIGLIKGFYNKYISRSLDLGFYRELNESSKFRLSLKNGEQYLLETIDSVEHINIIYNAQIIQSLFEIASTILFNK